jgi:hypothetical protein
MRSEMNRGDKCMNSNMYMRTHAMIHTSIDDINYSPDAVEKAVTARRWIRKEEKRW